MLIKYVTEIEKDENCQYDAEYSFDLHIIGELLEKELLDEEKLNKKLYDEEELNGFLKQVQFKFKNKSKSNHLKKTLAQEVLLKARILYKDNKSFINWMIGFTLHFGFKLFISSLGIPPRE